MPAGTITQDCWPAFGVNGTVHHDALGEMLPVPFHPSRWRQRNEQPWPVGAPVHFEIFDTPHGRVARFLRDPS